MTSLRIKDLLNVITDMCPIKIYVNEELEWDDDTGTLDEYYVFFQRPDYVEFLSFKITAFHHSIVYIKTI